MDGFVFEERCITEADSLTQLLFNLQARAVGDEQETQNAQNCYWVISFYPIEV